MDITTAERRHKLPKTIKHWFRSNKIKPEGGWHASGCLGWRRDWTEIAPYFIGRNRRWRFNLNPATGDGWLQVSCSLDDFDRWANSAGPTVPMPKNKREFDLVIINLLSVGDVK